jgi:crossover junction endodeoxyribonuclease RusA
VKIRVNGIPAPQGSKRHVGGGRMVEQSRAVGPWREAVRTETQHAVACEPNGVGIPPGRPVCVRIMFLLIRPKTAPKSRRFPDKRPDLDKLCRAVLDGLTAGGAFADDGQVVTLFAWKHFARGTETPGCEINVEEL